MKLGDRIPELPEVETFKRYIDATSLHKPIKTVQIDTSKLLERESKKSIKENLKNASFVKSYRRGKYVFVEMDNEKFLILHFGMTGFVKYFKNIKDKPSHTRLLVEFENGYFFAFHNQRLFGKIGLTKNIEMYLKKKKIGIDALEISLETFIDFIKKRKSMMKPFLMNQSVIAGIGNIYADEILFQSNIHPKTSSDQLSNGEIETLFQCLKNVLEKSIEVNANLKKLPKNYIISERRKDGRCPIDEKPLRTIKVNGRTTYFCPRHQKTK